MLASTMSATMPSIAPSILFGALLAGLIHGSTRAEEGPGDAFLEQYARTYRFSLGQPARIRATPDGRAVLFLRSGPTSFTRNLYELEIATGDESELVTAEALLAGDAEVLTAEEKARRERMRLAARGIASFSLSSDGKRILVPLAGRLFVVERATRRVTELDAAAGNLLDPRFSPDGARIAYVRDGDLHVLDIAKGPERRLTRSASDTVSNGLAEFVAQEEMSRFEGYWWSPDSRRLIYQETDTGGMETMHILDPIHPEKEPASWPYPRPGRKNAAVRLGIVDADGGETSWIEWDRDGFEYVAHVEWTLPEMPTVVVQNRRQTEQRLLAIDPSKGTTRPLLIEQDSAWLDIDERMPLWIPGGRSFLWTSFRNGEFELQLRAADGHLERPLTPAGFGLRRFGHLLPDGRVIVEASVDPTRSELFRLDLSGETAPVRLTDEPGVHTVESGLTGPLYIHVSRPLDGAPSWNVHDSDGVTDRQLASHAENPPLTPHLEFTTVGSDPSFHAALIRPTTFDPERRYPVIVHVYGGPTSQMVLADPRRYLIDQWIAEHGYVVVAIDGRGTPHRGRDWHRAVKGDLIDLPLQDQTLVLTLLGERYRELDLARVGIYGWSFGGYFSAMAVMREPELFRAAVAGAPVVAWENYDTHYTERYMDLPENNPEGYRAANVLSYARGLRRPLLLIHGTDDDNVYFAHSLMLADALFLAGKPFDFLPLPGFTHMVPDPTVTTRLYSRILDHFRVALAGEAAQ